MAVFSHRDIIGPAYYGAWNDFFDRKYATMCFSGGRGCVSGDTLIDTPSGKVRVDEFQGGEVFTVVEGKVVVRVAEKPKQYEEQDIYRLTARNGRSIAVTDEHRFLTPTGDWKMAKDFAPGDRIVSVNALGELDETTVETVLYERRERYWDFTVWGTHCYVAEGFVSHNSLKSSFISVAIILGLERDAAEALQRKKAGDPRWKHYLTHAVCYRKVFGTCEQSVYSQLVWAIEKLGLAAEYECKKSPLKIIRKKTGQMILFRGLDDPLKSKSIKAPYSFFRYCWFEEAAEFDGIEEIRNVKQSVQRGGHQFVTFYSYNPPETSANWVNFTMAELAAKDPTFHKYDSDYRSVPREWLGDQFFKEAELLLSINERAYRHEYLGEITGNGGTVFPNVRGVSVTDEDISHFSNIHWGCDFGSVDPTVLIGMEYERFNHRLIIFSEVYESNMLLDEMERRFKEAYFGYEYIMADCAAKQMIMELENRGLNMMPCQKGADSILHGIKWLQNLREICIDVNRCPNTYREFTLYEYEKDRLTQKFTSKFPDKDNHSVDSCLSLDTLVWTADGKRKIGSLVGKTGRLFAYDRKSGQVVETPFRNVRVTRRNARLVRVRVADDANRWAYVDCTPDHRILTSRGWMEAEYLNVGDRIVCADGLRLVTSVRDREGLHDVYDLEVPRYRNFIVNGGIVVHNCRYATEEIALNAGFF